MNTLITTALARAHAGLSVIPTTADKRPACAWKAFTERIPSDREIETVFARAEGIGIVCGKVSGNLELLDFDDGGSAFEPWFCTIPEYLAKRLVVEQSPSGGKHVFYRVAEGYDVPGNRKLAMKADGHVLIETRGEGGYVKCAPSKGYELMSGDFLHIQTVSPFEEQVLIDAAVALDEKKVELPNGTLNADRTKRSRAEGATDDDNSTRAVVGTQVSPDFACREATCGQKTPWDDYNERGDFASLLESHGWKRTKSGDNEHWERPGKDDRSTSATWNGVVFFVFSSNADGFEPNRGYNKFQVFAILECGGDTHEAARRLRSQGYGSSLPVIPRASIPVPKSPVATQTDQPTNGPTDKPTGKKGTCVQTNAPADPGPLPDELLHVPGFVDGLIEYTLATAPYPNRTLAFCGALAMLSHLTGRNFRDERNLRTNIYLLALADSGVGKDYPRKVNMNLAAAVNIMPTMADRFASAEGLEDALLVHPTSLFQVDEVDTMFAALQEKKDAAIEKVYGALMQFATSSDTTYAMRKKAITTTGGKASKFDKVRSRGIREPHLTLLGCAIPKYLYSALSERALENGLLSRCLILEAGRRGKAGTPHAEPFPEDVLDAARALVAHGGFEGLDLDDLDAILSGSTEADCPEPITVIETDEAKALHAEIVAKCEALYDAAKETSAKALWTRGAEKTAKLALLYAISENVHEPIITPPAIEWGWRIVDHLTRRMLYQASVYVHDNEFDALRQKAIRYLKEATDETMRHGALLKRMHIDADTFRRVIETMLQCETVTALQSPSGAVLYKLID